MWVLVEIPVKGNSPVPRFDQGKRPFVNRRVDEVMVMMSGHFREQRALT
jgi:hypothetical protein